MQAEEKTTKKKHSNNNKSGEHKCCKLKNTQMSPQHAFKILQYDDELNEIISKEWAWTSSHLMCACANVKIYEKSVFCL